jgi:cysteine dioxygenase
VVQNKNNASGVKKIQQLSDWLAQHPFEANEFKKLIATLRLSYSDFQPYCRFSPDAYTRNVLIQSEDYELVLICWDAGQLSPVHNHGFSQCFVHCLEGDVQENIYACENDTFTFQTAKKLIVGESTFVNDQHFYHQFGNASKTAQAVTLHLYSPKIMYQCQ